MVKMLPMPASMLPFHPLPYRRKQRKMPLIRPKPFRKEADEETVKAEAVTEHAEAESKPEDSDEEKLFRKRQKKWLLMLPKKIRGRNAGSLSSDLLLLKFKSVQIAIPSLLQFAHFLFLSFFQRFF